MNWTPKALCDSSTFFRFLLYFESSFDDISPCYHPNLQEWKFHMLHTRMLIIFCSGYWSKAKGTATWTQGWIHLLVFLCYQLRVISCTSSSLAWFLQHKLNKLLLCLPSIWKYLHIDTQNTDAKQLKYRNTAHIIFCDMKINEKNRWMQPKEFAL